MERPAGNTDEIIDRRSFSTGDIVREIWSSLSLPQGALDKVHLDGPGCEYPTSFKVGHVAQASIALSALSAALVDSLRPSRSGAVRQVRVSRLEACLEFITERLYTLDGVRPSARWGDVLGLHASSDGHVRIHDSMPNHRDGALKLLGLPLDASREDVAAKVRRWKKLELEQAAHVNRLAIYALRSYGEWDATPHAQALSDLPVVLRKISNDGPKGLPIHMLDNGDLCLRGLRILEFSRVIAGPLAGMALASHGADVLWVTSPNLPSLPSLDRILSRGKRSIQLDLNEAEDCETLRDLAKDCDVFVQGYRPGGLSSRGFGPDRLAELRPGIVYANMSAFGPDGPWSNRRGFDSLVQTCSGMNVSEAEHHGSGEVARLMPCQALDHTAGYLLATGIAAAVYRRAIEGGSWEVHVSLAGTMKYLRSLGQLRSSKGFDTPDPIEAISADMFEESNTGFGRMRALKLASQIDGAKPRFDHMPKALGSDEARWLS